MEITTFTRTFALTLLGATLLCGGIGAQTRLKKTKTASKLPMPAASVMKNAPASFNHGLVLKAKGTTSDILVDEDFSNFTAGTPGNPDTTQVLASYYGDPGPYIADGYMQQDGWSGTFVYMSGGKCTLLPPNLSVSAALNTPLGDYSGHITVTLRARALPCDGTGSSLNIVAAKGGLGNSSDYADTDDTYGYDTRLYVSQGWAEVSYEFDNYSADNDGFICISTSGTVEIDDLKITTTPTFIAAPKVLSPTNFTKDGFTINWQTVRKSFNYYIDLYKKTYLSDEDAVYVSDFDGTDPLGDSKFTFSLGDGSGVKDGEGVDGTNALAAHNGDTITSPEASLSKYRNLKFYMKVVEPSAASQYDYEGYIYLDFLSEKGWKEYGAFYADMFAEGDEVDLDEEMYGEFKNLYHGVRLRFDGLPADGYVLLDNLEATIAPEARLDTIEGEFPGYYYDQAKGGATSYTFTGLEPEGDYYYTIKSHYVSQFSTPTLYHALGVSTPELKPASDIDPRGSYTANYEPSPKATGYIVTNYGVKSVECDGWTDILNETFDKVDASVTTNTDPYNPDMMGNYFEDTSLDAYTSVPGWIGVGTTLAQGCIGIQEASFVSSLLITPELYLANNNQFRLGLKAYGNVGSNLVVSIDGKTMKIAFQDDGKGNGVMEGSVDIAETGKALQMKFYTDDTTPFMFDYVKVSQQLKKGDRLYTMLSRQEVGADETSATFNNLGDLTDYKEFAYNVAAKIVMDDESAKSEVSDFMLVDLENGTSLSSLTNINKALSDGTQVVGRYSLDGTRLQRPVKGINILKMSDGRTVKQIVK